MPPLLDSSVGITLTWSYQFSRGPDFQLLSGNGLDTKPSLAPFLFSDSVPHFPTRFPTRDHPPKKPLILALGNQKPTQRPCLELLHLLFANNILKDQPKYNLFRFFLNLTTVKQSFSHFVPTVLHFVMAIINCYLN